jgi:DNA-binding NarL/FixJ family response regulator
MGDVAMTTRQVSGKSIRVAIVDDHPLMRVGVAAIIDATEDMKVVAQCASAEEAVRLYTEHLPDLMLMDLRLPGMSGVGAIRAIRKDWPHARFVVLTTYEGDEDIYQALESGARGYLIKGMPHEALIAALRKVHEGGQFLPPPVKRALASRHPAGELSPRELEVLQAMADGCSNREIAAALHIKEATVKSHVSVILMRLEVTDRTQAVVAALRRGIVHL